MGKTAASFVAVFRIFKKYSIQVKSCYKDFDRISNAHRFCWALVET